MIDWTQSDNLSDINNLRVKANENVFDQPVFD